MDGDDEDEILGGFIFENFMGQKIKEIWFEFKGREIK